VTVAFQEVPLPLGLPESPVSLGPVVERRREPARLLAPAQAALTVVAYGLPVPQGSKRIGRRGDKPTVLDDNKNRLDRWRTTVAWAARQAMSRQFPDRKPLDGPLAAEVTFTLPRPRTVKRAWPLGQGEGDVDKLLRAVFDALSVNVRVIREDARFVQVLARKVYPGSGVVDALEEPGVVAHVWRMPEAGV